MVLKNIVIDIKLDNKPPIYPPDPDGNEVIAVECDDSVKLGMLYKNGEFLGKEPDNISPQPTQLDRIEEQQLATMEAIASIYEENSANRLNDMEVQATLYEAILALGGEI